MAAVCATKCRQVHGPLPELALLPRPLLGAACPVRMHRRQRQLMPHRDGPSGTEGGGGLSACRHVMLLLHDQNKLLILVEGVRRRTGKL